jgi:DNA-binding PadR family transcriptional regulator
MEIAMRHTHIDPDDVRRGGPRGEGRRRWQPPFERGRAFDGPWGPPGFGPGGPGGFGGRGFGRHGGRGRGRARRGDVRAAILFLLAERPMHGYEIIQELDDRTGGVWRPSPGSVYPALQLLEDEGLIRSEESSGRRLFELTDAGREAHAALPEDGKPWEQVTAAVNPVNLQLRDGVAQIHLAVHQVAGAGTEEQKAKAAQILTETRKALYRLLAEDD